jgi:GntR family transcriptional regulator
VSERLPLHLSEASGLPFYRQIEDQIAELIRSGRLSSGARLPSVRQLASQTLVSLITVRRAYADLDRDGLIVRRQGQGTFVAEGVAAASADRAKAEARDKLLQAVAQSRQRGLEPAAIRAVVDEALEGA